jgi:hypothetical protein
MDEKKTQSKLIPVRLVGTTGKSALVEWLDKKSLHRASLPIEKVADKIDLELLEAAPAFGVPWADMPIKSVTGEQLQAAMYAAGFWTDQDVMKRAPEIFGVLQALLGLHLGSLVEFAAKYKLNEVK